MIQVGVTPPLLLFKHPLVVDKPALWKKTLNPTW